MLRQFARDSIVYGVAGVLARGISLILIPLYTRALGPSDYGIVDLVTVCGGLLQIIVALEITQGLARYYADASNSGESGGYASSALWFTAVGYFILIVVVLVMRDRAYEWLVGESPGKVMPRSVIPLGLAVIASNGLFYFAQNQLRWELQPVQYAKASLTTVVTTLTLSVILVLWQRLGVFGVLWAQVIGNACGGALGYYYTRRSLRHGFRWDACRRMLQFSLPLVPSSLGVLLALYIDRIAIKKLMTLGDVGIFGVGYRVVSVVTILMVGIQAALTPLIFKNYRNPDTPSQLARLFRLFCGAALLLCAALGIFAPEIVRLITAPPYYGAAAVIPLLAPATLLSSMYIFAPGPGIAARTGIIAVINISTAILNTGLNWLLIPEMGIRGAALATFISALSAFCAYMVASQRWYPVPHRWRPLLLSAAITALLVVMSEGGNLPEGKAIVFRTCALATVACTVLATGVARPSELRQFVAWVSAATRIRVARSSA